MKVLFATGVILAIAGLVFTIAASWTTTLESCPILTTSCPPNPSSFQVNSETYVGVIVGIFGVAFAGIDLIRARARTRYLRDFPKD
jgi:hypothetical protein